MSVQTASPASPPKPQGASFAELFTPKLVTVLREGYTLKGAAQAIRKGSTAKIAERAPAPVPVAAPPVVTAAPVQPDILPQLRAIRNRLEAALAA